MIHFPPRVVHLESPAFLATGSGWMACPSNRSRQPNILAFSDVNSSPGSRPRAGLRDPRFLPIRLGGIGAGTSNFRPIAIEEGRREWSRRRGDGGGLLGGVTIFEQDEREELAEEELPKRKERVGVVFESGRAAELGVGRVPLEPGSARGEEVEVGKGYSYGLDRSKWYGVPTKSVSPSSLELETSFAEFEGIKIGVGTGFDRDVVLVITRYRAWMP